jgi:glucuronate isomerase
MTGDGFLHPDRLLPAEPETRTVARDLYEAIRGLPIVSPHGHTDPAWFALDTAFENAASMLVIPDHYLLRMLHSRGVPFEALGQKGGGETADPHAIWRLFAAAYELFAGTPSRLWVDHAMGAVLGCGERLSADNADRLYDQIGEKLASPEFRPRQLLDRFNIEVIATTEGALDPLTHHAALKRDGLGNRVRTTYRPDALTDPDNPTFAEDLRQLGELTNEDTSSFVGMLAAHAKRRAFFREHGATATDHGVPSALTADLDPDAKQRLLDGALAGTLTPIEAELFRAQMLTEMAGLSAEDGMVMQIHAASRRNTDARTFSRSGPNMGADIPLRADWTNGLHALLNRHGHAPDLRIIVFTLDESTYARELAPMAGYWPSLLIGPPWWFHDSPRGIRRYLDQVVETAGFANLAGFNDDTRALLSIPARHDVWRREVAGFLAGMVTDHRLERSEAAAIAADLAYGAAKRAYRL